MSQPNPFQLQPLEPVNVKEVFSQYARNWMWFLLALIACIGVAFLYLRYTTTEYHVESAIVITDDHDKSSVLPNSNLFDDLDLFKSSKNIDDEIEVLKGKSLMQRVLTELQLQVTYQKKGKIKDSEVYGTSLPINTTVIKVDSSAFDKKIALTILSDKQFKFADGNGNAIYAFGDTINKPYGQFIISATPWFKSSADNTILIKFNSFKKLVAAYLADLSITPVNKNGNVLKLGLNTTVPQRGIDVLNRLIKAYDLETIENKNEIATKTINFIDDRLIYLVQELSGVEKDVENYKQKNDITDISSESQQYLENTGEYERKLNEYEIQISILQSIQNYLTAKADNNIVPSSLTITDATLTELINNFNQLQLQRQRLLKSNYESSPVVQSVTEQLAVLRQSILENINNVKQSLTIARNSVRGKDARFQTLKRKVPLVERQLLEIKRQQNIKESLYQYLLQKREEATLSKAAAVSSLRIIDKADVNENPIKPKPVLVALLAITGALLLPVGGIAVRNLLKNRITDIKDIRSIGAPVLGEIIHTPLAQKLLVTPGSRTIMAELFRLLRSKLQLSAAENKNKVYLITSTMSGEGKTFFCVNMGATLALAGKKVILLEFDLRKPMLLSGMGINADTGITDYLVSGVDDLNSLIHKVPDFEHLHVMGAGAIPPNPSELILSERNNELFAYLREMYDHIIVDSPPVGIIADGYSLSPFADRTLYILRYNYTYQSQVPLIKDMYEKNSLKNMMLVLNDSQPQNMQQYGYGYQYGYNYGYTTDEPKQGWFDKTFKKKHQS